MKSVLLIAIGVSAASVAWAQNSPPQNPPAGRNPAIGADPCGGGPIQDGRDIQPNPARDQCLSQRRDVPLTPDNTDVDLGAKGVPQTLLPYGSPNTPPRGEVPH